MGWVLHVDLDQFLVAVELQRHPELVGRPVVVGGRGDPTERGVASTASYEARAYGVSSGTPLRTAAKRLPEDAVFLPVDKSAYDAMSARVMAALRSFPVDVEVLGWDEAFVGPRPGTEESDPAELAEAIRARVHEQTGLTCSVGIGDNKLQAKLATGFGKPDGVGRLHSADWDVVMGPRPVDALWGIGSRTRARLETLGVRTVAELASTTAASLAAEFGPRTGPWLRRLGRGADSSPVDPTPWVPRGHGRELTLQRDTDDWDEVAARARSLAHQVADDIAREGRPAARVGVKIRYVPFTTRQRSLTLPEPTGDPLALAEAAVSLLERFDRSRTVRLIGVRAEMVEVASASEVEQ
jgi:DNA polymerase IV